MSVSPMAKALWTITAWVGVLRLGSTWAKNFGMRFSRPIACRMRMMPLLELTMTANIDETDAMMIGQVIHDAYFVASMFHGVAEPERPLVVEMPKPFTSAQMQNT